MDNKKPLRVLWLINHSSARKFEIPMLQQIGINEIFTPKSYPHEVAFRSASVDYAFDEQLTIPADALEILNKQNWYGSPSTEAWDIANQYFDILFFIPYKAETLKSILTKFHGSVLLRAYGMVEGNNYSNVCRYFLPNKLGPLLAKIGRRFWFAEAYNHLHNVENMNLVKRGIYLPLGMANATMADKWRGSDKRIFFVCPDIGTNSYYKEIYLRFVKDFKGLPYLIGGSQSINQSDSNIAGYLPAEAHAKNMSELRVMYYHSTEPNHIHYHPFEAIRSGMPLIFMAGGMLDKMGGVNLPGRCKTIEEAKSKLKRILNDDKQLIQQIRQTQHILLERMKPENCRAAWENGFKRIINELEEYRAEQTERPIYVNRKKRIAVIIPVGYRGGSLRGAKLLAEAIDIGSKQFDEQCEVVFAHPEMEQLEKSAELDDLSASIKRRAFSWQYLSSAEATRAMRYAGHEDWNAANQTYMVPNDNIQHFYDCDLWVVISDRLEHPLLPMRQTILMVYDYLQRYVPILPNGADQPFLNAARQAEKVLVTTEFTHRDALQYAGLTPDRVQKLPMLAPDFSLQEKTQGSIGGSTERDYFIWTTNAAPHKNHVNAIKALDIYYCELDGQLECMITGVNTKELLKGQQPHLMEMANIVEKNRILKKRLKWQGELADKQYRKTLQAAAFLWHAGRIDNGTFSVIEAAYLGVPALSSSYPAMHEIDQQFTLNLIWADADSPRQMAEQLKYMETHALQLRKQLPSSEWLKQQQVENLASHYWEVIRECL